MTVSSSTGRDWKDSIVVKILYSQTTVDGPAKIYTTNQSGDVTDTVTLSVSHKTDTCENEGDSHGA